MAFGISGSTSDSVMLGADAVVVGYDVRTQRALVADYNISALTPVSPV